VPVTVLILKHCYWLLQLEINLYTGEVEQGQDGQSLLAPNPQICLVNQDFRCQY